MASLFEPPYTIALFFSGTIHSTSTLCQIRSIHRGCEIFRAGVSVARSGVVQQAKIAATTMIAGTGQWVAEDSEDAGTAYSSHGEEFTTNGARIHQLALVSTPRRFSYTQLFGPDSRHSPPVI